MPRKKVEANKNNEEGNAVASRLEELKAALAKGNVLLGSRGVLKALKMKSLKAVFVASNCPQSTKDDIASYAKIAGVAIESFDGSAKQLGIFCGKPFAVASLAVAEKKK